MVSWLVFQHSLVGQQILNLYGWILATGVEARRFCGSDWNRVGLGIEEKGEGDWAW